MYLQISVIDNGPGISESEQLTMFNPVDKYSYHDPKASNSALGLRLCQKICQSLGGSI